MTELKSCPFCGEAAVLHRDETSSRSRGFHLVYHIACKSVNCDCYTESYDQESNAVKFWNARPSPWISVEDGLPEDKSYVLSYRPKAVGSKVRYCFYHSKSDILFDSLLDVTHWMPVPKLPC